MNEIFGEENFIADIIWEKRYTRSNDAKMMASLVDHNLFFRKSDTLSYLREPRTDKANSIYGNPDNDPNGPWTSVSYVSQRTKEQRPNLSYGVVHPFNQIEIEHPTNAWKFSKEQYKKHVKENKLYWGKDGGQTYPRLKKYISEVENKGMVPINLWNYKETGTVDDGTKEVDNLIGKDLFDYPKPTSLIKRVMRMVSLEKDDIILDFFAGSGTTAHAVMDLNKDDNGKRRYICVQLPEQCDEKSDAYKAGYKTIAEISKERIRRAGKKIQEEINKEIADLEVKKAALKGQLPTDENKAELQALEERISSLKSQDLGFKVLKLEQSNFKQWRQLDAGDNNDRQRAAEALAAQMKLFVDPVAATATTENMVYELLLKSGKDLNSRIARQGIFYTINDNELVLLLEEASEAIMEAVIALKPAKAIALDRLFKGNDQLKTNTVLQMKDAGIEFKTI